MGFLGFCSCVKRLGDSKELVKDGSFFFMCFVVSVMIFVLLGNCYFFVGDFVFFVFFTRLGFL